MNNRKDPTLSAWQERMRRYRRFRIAILVFLLFIAGAYFTGLLSASLGVLSPVTSLLGLSEMAPDEQGAQMLTAFAGMFTILILGATAFLTYLGYTSIRDAQIREKTLELIEKTNEDQDIFMLFEQLRYVRFKYKEEINFDDVYTDYIQFVENEMNDQNRHEVFRKDYDYIVHLLNLYETWAVGLHFRSLDEEMLMEFWRRPFIVHWQALVKFVYGLRLKRNDPDAYVNAEALVMRWANPEEQKRIETLIDEWRAKWEPPNQSSNLISRVFSRRAA